MRLNQLPSDMHAGTSPDANDFGGVLFVNLMQSLRRFGFGPGTPSHGLFQGRKGARTTHPPLFYPLARPQPGPGPIKIPVNSCSPPVISLCHHPIRPLPHCKGASAPFFLFRHTFIHYPSASLFSPLSSSFPHKPFGSFRPLNQLTARRSVPARSLAISSTRRH